MSDGAGAVIGEDDFEFISLMAGDQCFCLELGRVREIRRWEPVTMLPHSASHVLGVVNLRGAVVPIVDLAQRLGFSKVEPTQRNVIIISRYSDQVVGFLVQSVSEIFTINASEVKEAPKLGGAIENPFIEGVISLNDDLVRVINIDALMTSQLENGGVGDVDNQ